MALRGPIADASLERAVTMVRMVFGRVEVVGDVSSGTVPPAPVDGAEPDRGDLEEDYPGNVTLDGVPLAHSTLFEDADASG